jgi:hypothetical protein
MKSALLAEKARTGLGAIAVLRSIQPPPKKPSASAIEHWLSGKPQTVNAEHYTLILNAWRALPDNAPTKRRPLKITSSRIEVSEDMRATLRRIHAVAPPRYLRGAPDGFNATKLAHVLNGRDRTIPKSVWDFILAQDRET